MKLKRVRLMVSIFIQLDLFGVVIHNDRMDTAQDLLDFSESCETFSMFRII